MPNENYYQRLICKQIRSEGGYGQKWATQYAVGVPDLILSHPDTGPLFVELKLFKDAPKGFDRKIDTTQKQKIELFRLRDAGATALVGVVIEWQKGIKTPKTLVLVPPETLSLSAADLDERLWPMVRMSPPKEFSITFLLNIAMMRGLCQNTDRQLRSR